MNINIALYKDSSVVTYRATIYLNGAPYAELAIDLNGNIIGGIRLLGLKNNAMTNIHIDNLQPSTDYTFTIDALDNKGTIVNRQEGEFSTKDEQTALPLTQDMVIQKTVKYLRNNQIVILSPDGKCYDMNGRRL